MPFSNVLYKNITGVDYYKELYFKYLHNECNRKELKKILLWLNDPSNSFEIESLMREDWDKFGFSSESNASNLTFEAVRDKIKAGTKIQPESEHTYSIGKILARIAAFFILPAAVGYLSYLISSGPKAEENLVWNEIKAPLGSKTIIRLGDSTDVWLNSGSTLRFPQKFSGEFREVTLSGEAFFDVKKDTEHPFIVRAHELNIKVLGTSFNVKAYPEERTIETTLVKGLVIITKNNETSEKDTLYLNPNQRATYVKDNGKLLLAETEKEVIKKEQPVAQQEKLVHAEKIIIAKNVDPEPFTAWKDDKLVFKNEEFESLCIKLERWYGVEINIKNEALKKYHYTGILQKETINDVIKILGYTMPIKYCIDHSVINIWMGNGEKCKN